MTVLYWEGFDCTPATRAIEHPDMVHVHELDERKLGQAFLDFDNAWRAYCQRYGAAPDWRYHCFRGVRGLVRDVRP